MFQLAIILVLLLLDKDELSVPNNKIDASWLLSTTYINLNILKKIDFIEQYLKEDVKPLIHSIAESYPVFKGNNQYCCGIILYLF